MKEELEWLSENMPEGWVLEWSELDELWWLYRHPKADDKIMWVSPELADIGLAPLTALLKQDLLESRWYCVVAQSKQRKWGCSLQRGRIRQKGFRGDTEFEAVYSAYRSTRRSE